MKHGTEPCHGIGETQASGKDVFKGGDLILQNRKLQPMGEKTEGSGK